MPAPVQTVVSNRITTEQMERRIHRVTYHRLPGTSLTICCMVLDNGWIATGESACVDPGNYDQFVGERLAYHKAFGTLWPLFGFMLAEDRFRKERGL